MLRELLVLIFGTGALLIAHQYPELTIWIEEIWIVEYHNFTLGDIWFATVEIRPPSQTRLITRESAGHGKRGTLAGPSYSGIPPPDCVWSAFPAVTASPNQNRQTSKIRRTTKKSRYPAYQLPDKTVPLSTRGRDPRGLSFFYKAPSSFKIFRLFSEPRLYPPVLPSDRTTR